MFRLRRLLFIVLTAVALIGTFELGILYSHRNAVGLMSQMPQHRADDSRALTEKIVQLETNDKVNREAYRQIELQLAELQDKIIEQQEELAFYRGVMGGTSRSPVSVQEFVLQPGGTPHEFHLHLVLAQSRRADRQVSGAVGLRLEGNSGGRPVTLGLADVVSGGTTTGALLQFSFRYFQKLDADLSLPQGFTPSRVVVRLIPAARAGAPREESFPWVVRSS